MSWGSHPGLFVARHIAEHVVFPGRVIYDGLTGYARLDIDADIGIGDREVMQSVPHWFST